jgi:hypothetical protein
LGFAGTIVLVEDEEKDTGELGDGGGKRFVFGDEVSVRWHSLRSVGIEDAGKMAGRENACIELKIFEA